MSRRNRFIFIGVGILVLVVVVALVSIPRFLNADSFRMDIESNLSNALGRKVTLGKLDLSLWSGSLVAQQASVADDPAFSNQPFLRASSVKIRVALLPLIFSRELHIEGFQLMAPQITLLRASDGAWNYSSIGRAAGKTGNMQAESGAMIPNFTASQVDVSDGTLNLGTLNPGTLNPGGAPSRVYNGISLEVKNFSFEKAFPFTASARLPGAGTVSIRGDAGPMDPRDISHTRLTAHAEVKHLDLAAAGVLNGNSGVTGQVADISIDATWSGQNLHVANLLIDSPNLAIDRAAAHPADASVADQAADRAVDQAVDHEAAAPVNNSMIDTLSVNHVTVKNGVITVADAGHPAVSAVYRQVNLAASNFSPKTSSPFTLSAQLPRGGSLRSSGNAGPLDRQNVAATPIDAEISLKHADLSASGVIAPSSGIGGILNFDARATSDGHALNANGVAHIEGLRLAKTGSPSPEPVEARFAGTENLQSQAGQLQHSTITIGTAVVNVAGTYQTAAAVTQVDLKADAPGILIDQIQSFLPSLGVKLPPGARLQGGTLTTSLSITGPIDNTVISGPVRLDNMQLTGFDLGSQLPGIAPLIGLHPASSTAIRLLSLNLRIAGGVIRTDNLVLEVPALGSLTGSGTIAAGGALDYHVILKPAAMSGAGAGESGGLAGQLMGMIPGGAGKAIGGLAANALKNGIPVAIGGTTVHPSFAPSLLGMPGGAGHKAPNPGNSPENIFGGLLGGKR